MKLHRLMGLNALGSVYLGLLGLAIKITFESVHRFGE
jgi:hypothetical protein